LKNLKTITNVDCGYAHSIAIAGQISHFFQIRNLFFFFLENGDAYSWGFGEQGALGLGDSENRYIPTLMTSFIQKDIKIRQVSAGSHHSAFISSINKINSHLKKVRELFSHAVLVTVDN
jgi:alpha-tubulin suppressor-like RCC1 family protein